MKTLATIQRIPILIAEDERYSKYIAGMRIDADGANGQNGGRAAYMVGDAGSEHLGNGGMRMKDGQVVWAAAWGTDIVFMGRDGKPAVDSRGIIPSKTSYKYQGKRDLPEGQVDAETIAYIVVPPILIKGIGPVVLGCRAKVSYRGKSVDAVVADVGPAQKLGEASIATARALGIPDSPRSGGVEALEVTYELWPGTPAPGFLLQRANGTYAPTSILT